MKLEINVTSQHLVALFLAVVIVAGISYAVAQTGAPNPGHFADDIGPGTFAEGYYVFPSISRIGIGTDPETALDVAGDIRAANIILGGVSRNTWPVLTCTTKSENGGGEIYCDEGWTMTGGGCVWRSDGNDRYVYSHPYGNGWFCRDDDGPVNSRYVRCCRIE